MWSSWDTLCSSPGFLGSWIHGSCGGKVYGPAVDNRTRRSVSHFLFLTAGLCPNVLKYDDVSLMIVFQVDSHLGSGT